jgi:hypothetical protein
MRNAGTAQGKRIRSSEEPEALDSSQQQVVCKQAMPSMGIQQVSTQTTENPGEILLIKDSFFFFKPKLKRLCALHR